LRALRTIVLDTSAFIQGYTTSNPDTLLYTTPLVLDEVLDEIAQMRIKNWIQTGKLVVETPDIETQKHVVNQAKRMGELQALSEADLSIIALAYQLSRRGEVVLISDDYGVQNLSDELGLRYMGAGTRGISRRFQWIHYCPGCRTQYDKPQIDDVCPICGTPLKRKPGKKTRLRGGV